MSKIHKKIIPVLVLALAWAIPLPSQAINLVSFGLGAITNMFTAIVNLLIDFVGGNLVTLAGGLVNWVFQFQEFINVPVVQAGWVISRDIANMAFILIMLAIAFATILRMEEYGIKKLLPKLIVIALLLNFSLIISGVFIDIGNSLGYFFVSGGNPEAKIADNIMSAVRIGHLVTINQLTGGNDDLSNTTVLLATSIVRLIFTIIVAFLLFALAFIMVYRMVHLWVLIILAPLAWVCVAVPKAGGYYTKWWTKFLQWSFFPVVMGFFIFLGLLAGSTASNAFFSQGADLIEQTGSIWTQFASSVLQYIVVVFIMFMGLSTAASWGLQGAGTMMGLAGSAKNAALGYLKGGALGAARLAGKAAMVAPKAAKTGLERSPIGRAVDRFQERLERVPLVGRALGGPGALMAQKQKRLEEAKKETSNKRTEDLRTTVNQAVLDQGGLARRAAAMSELAKRGQLQDEDARHLPDFQTAGGDMREIMRTRPDFAFRPDVQSLIAVDTNLARGDRQEREALQTFRDGIETVNEIQRERDALPQNHPRREELNRELEDRAGFFQEQVGRLFFPKGESQMANIQVEAVADPNIRQMIASGFTAAGNLQQGFLERLAKENPATFSEIAGSREFINAAHDFRTGVLNFLTGTPGIQVMAQNTFSAIQRTREEERERQRIEREETIKEQRHARQAQQQRPPLTDQFGNPIAPANP